MAITFDTPSHGGIIGASSLTISHTVGSGSDRALLVMASCVNSTDYLASATVTYGGTSLGSPIITPAAGASNNYAYAWLMVNPPSGTANVVITPSAGAYVDAKVVSAAGVAQTSTVDATAKFVGISASTRTLSISTTSGGAAVDFVCVRTPSFAATPDASQTALGGALSVAGGSSTSVASYKAHPVADMQWTWTGNPGVAHMAAALKAATAPDTTAPTLTSPTGSGGALTCSGSVSTDEGNGTLYAVVTASATAPSAAQVKAGQDHTGSAALRVVSQAVSGTGVQSVASGAVTAGTRYWHYMHEDAAANQSTVASSASFTVTASAPTINSQPSNQTVTAPATATFTVSATASGGSLSYQWQRQPAGGGGYANVSGGSGATTASYTTGTTSVTGGGHNNGDTYRVLVTDSNGTTTSSVATLTVNAAPVGLTSSPLTDNTGTLHLSAPFEAFVLNVTTGALVLRKQSLTSHASTGVVTFTDAALTAATQYRVVWRRTDTGAQGIELLTAA